MTHVLAALMLAGVAVLPEAEDDLAVVRRALAARPSAAVASARAPATLGPARKAERPRWLKVRVVEERSRQARVSVDLPLTLVRALSLDCPLEPSRRLSEVLEALESGQRLVEIEADDATVRVWVE